MLGGELMYHFIVTVIMTALVAMFVLWRYRVVVLAGMSSTKGQILPVPAASRPLPPQAKSVEKEAARDWERAVHRRVIIAWLVSVSIAAPILALPYLASLDFPLSPAHLVLVIGVLLSAAVPMISVSLAWPFWRGLRFWSWMLVAGAIAAVAASALQRIFTGRVPTLDQLLNVAVFLQLAAAMLWLPALLLWATGSVKLRGVAPITFVGLLMFGLAPFLGWRAIEALARTSAGTEALLAIPTKLFMHAAFILFALPVGWLAWKRLRAVAAGYDSKRFSDVQLLARTWWLMFVACIAMEMISSPSYRWWYGARCAASYVVFVQSSSRVFGWLGVAQESRPPRTLLLLRVFGYTKRTEKLFDRIGSRWRYFGPVTMIAAPDVVARTVDPMDYLHYILGSVDQTFVRSAGDLQRRITTIDMGRDPDGRYRVNEFCCADNTWQATIVELMRRCDVVLMDLRGITRERRGCEFELQQLAARVEADCVVLVVDAATDRALARDALGEAANAVTFFELNDNRPGATDSLFQVLLRAAR